MLFKIDNLSVTINDRQILHEYKLEIKKGEIHAIMGPNGSGKSTLSRVIMGDTRYNVLDGHIYFNDQDITNMPTDERARLGIFLAMQSPIEIEGVTNADFLRSALNAKSKESINLYDLVKKIEKTTEDLKMDAKMLHRSINQGFSGGERKKNEILQMKILEPSLIIMDEIDSGLDVDSLRIVSENINDYRTSHPDTSILLITHYQRILDYIKPDYVHIMTCGKIVKTGDYKLAFEIENKGYNLVDETKDKSSRISIMKEKGNDE